MSVADFEKAIHWLRTTGKERVILLGGEPTLHPFFKEFLEICRANHMIVAVLTNMNFDQRIRDMLCAYDRCWLQANVNHPSTYKDGEYARVQDNIKAIIKKKIVGLRYIIGGENDDFHDIIRLAKDIKGQIRFSVANSPLICDGVIRCGQEQLRDIYVKEKIVNFLEACRHAKVHAVFARPVPQCLFSPAEIRAYRKNAIKFKCFVGRDGNYAARINVNPGLSVVACYGVPILGPALTSFGDYQALSDFYKEHFVRLRRTPAMPECSRCESFLNDQCQGGCLSERFYAHG